MPAQPVSKRPYNVCQVGLPIYSQAITPQTLHVCVWDGREIWGQERGKNSAALDSPASAPQTPPPVKSLLCTFASPLLFTGNALHPSLCLLKLSLSKFDSTRQLFLRKVHSISLYLFIL